MAPSQNHEALRYIESAIAQLLQSAMNADVDAAQAERIVDEMQELFFGPEVESHEVITRMEQPAHRQAVSRALLSFPMARGGAGIRTALVTRRVAFLAAQMDVLNSVLGDLTHHGTRIRMQLDEPPVGGPNVAEELKQLIAELREHYQQYADDETTSPLPRSLNDMLRNHHLAKFNRQGSSSYQHRLAALVQTATFQRVQRAVRLTDTFAAAQLALRSMPGALTCLAATGADAPTSLNDEEMAHLLQDIAALPPPGTLPDSHGQFHACADCNDGTPNTARHVAVCNSHGDVTRSHTAIRKLVVEACAQCELGLPNGRGEPMVGDINGTAKSADFEVEYGDGRVILGDVRQASIKMGNAVYARAATLDPDTVLQLGDHDKMAEYNGLNQTAPGDITPFTTSLETGAIGKNFKNFFNVLRQRTRDQGLAFGKAVDGDLRMVEFGSWLQPTKADYYLQRLSVLHRQCKTAKVLGSVQRARDALYGAPMQFHDEGVDIFDHVAASAEALRLLAAM